MSARSGRRTGNTDTRAAILNAARDSFTSRGYDRATIRLIARRAAVDPALVHHYFGTKERLFVEAMEFPVDPAVVLPALIEEGRERAAENLLRMFLSVWDSGAGNPVLALIRAAVTNERAAAMLREFLTGEVLARVAEALESPDAPLRASLAGSQLAGLVMARYVLEIEPLASLEREEVVRLIGPNIQRYLTGDLSAPG